MSYEKHTWQTGETITAEKLNNLEDGVASSGGGSELPITYLVFNYDSSSQKYSTNQMTYQELAPKSGMVYAFLEGGYDYSNRISFTPIHWLSVDGGQTRNLGFHIFRTWSTSETNAGISCDLYIINEDMTINHAAYSTKKLKYITE